MGYYGILWDIYRSVGVFNQSIASAQMDVKNGKMGVVSFTTIKKKDVISYNPQNRYFYTHLGDGRFLYRY